MAYKEEDVVLDSSSEEENSEAEAPESEVQEVQPEAVETPEVQAEEPAAEKEKEPEQKVPYQRFAKVNRKYREAQEKLAALEAKAPEATVEPDVSGKPVMPDIDPYDAEYKAKMAEYQENLTDWKLDQRDKATKERETQQKAEEIKKAASQKFDQFYQEDKEYQDLLNEVIENDEKVRFPQVLNEVIQVSEFGPQIDKYVLQHRDTLLPELESLPPVLQAVKVGEILSSLQSTPKAPAKKTTSAPPVIEVETSGSSRVQGDDAYLKERYGKSYQLT